MSKKNIEAVYPLSPMQQGMLFHALYATDSTMYVEQLSGILRGDLDVTAFEMAWQRVVDRHPILRSVFAWKNLDEPLQIVGRQVKVPIEKQDWTSLPMPDQQQRLEICLKLDRQRGFNLSKAPLMRLTLIKRADKDYQFIWAHHHILLDGWCTSIILNEVFSFYKAFHEGKDLRLQEPHPYRDYIAWLREQDQSQAETFWRKELKGFTAPTPLVVDKPATNEPAPEEARGTDHIELDDEKTTALRMFARRYHVTMNTLVQGAWAILLSRYSGNSDIVFGTTVSGRPATLAGAESMIGLLINTLPLRVRIAPDSTLVSWLRGLQDHNAELRQYEYSPLVQVQKCSEVPEGAPLFESLLTFENYVLKDSMAQENADFEIRELRSFSRINYPLGLAAIPDSKLSLLVQYDRTRFAATTIKRMLTHLKNLLEGFIPNGEQQIKSLPMLDDVELDQLLRDWNDTKGWFPKHLCMHEMFEAQSEKTPDAIALICGDERLTYRQLNAKANQLAHYLQSLGTGPDVPVALYMKRSIEMVVSVLAVLKSGGAYVPIDPAYPIQRIAFLLDDIQASVVLTLEEDSDKLPAHWSQIICLDTEWNRAASESDENPISGVTAENLAYIIYTSGSTGNPKGVMIPHRGVVNYLSWCASSYKVNEGRGVPLHSPLAFDLTVTSLFAPLMVGQELELLPDDASPEALAKALQEGGDFSLVKLTPAHLELLTLQLKPEQATGAARALVIGGEALSAESLNFWRRYAPETKLFNEYGPTETVVGCCVYQILPEQEHAGAIPIGRPIANTRLYILDESMRPVPPRVIGELYIGGEGVARGYYRRPAQTAAAFLPSPFGEEYETRLYKTGDLCRYRNDGIIEFIGRADEQVKIRGFRVELAEIESALSRHRDIREAAVGLRENESGKHLAAYLVLAEEQALTSDEIRDYLKKSLPEYMVPSSYEILDKLPLTPNGKVDRRALASFDKSSAQLKKEYVAPKTPVEEVLANIWAQVLNVRRVGIYDNFFDLGGHSIIALQVISRVHAIFQIEMPLPLLFEFPILTNLAEEIEKKIREEAQLVVSEIERVPRSDDLPLSFAQQRLWFLDQLEPDNPAYNSPLAVELLGHLNVEALEKSLNEIIRRHESLRTTFAIKDGRPVQVIAPDLLLSLPVEDLRDLAERERNMEANRRATAESESPFDLTTGPLLRARLLQLGGQDHIFLLTMHHIITDAWSMGIFVREISALYEAFSADKPSPLQDLPIQYGDFSCWQRDWLQGEVLEHHLSYWRDHLSGSLSVLELPTDRPRPSVQTYVGENEVFVIDKRITEGLRRVSQSQGATLYMTLLTVFDTLLCRYSGQEEIIVGTTVANRNRPEIEGLIGFFVNTLVMRVNVSADSTFAELVSRVRGVALGAYTHQDVPFEKLVEELQPERDLSRQPLFQVMFELQNTPMPELELPGLKFNFFETASKVTHFDLTLTVLEEGESLIGNLEYNSDLFDAGTIKRMANHLQRLSQEVVTNPLQRISELPLLTQEEERQLLVECNTTDAEVPHHLCAHQLFETQVRLRPDAVAAVFDNHGISYDHLNKRANRVARAIVKRGVIMDEVVALFLNRNLDLLVGILGVFKACGAYMSPDPSYPAKRLAQMIVQSRCALIVTTEELLPTLLRVFEHTPLEGRPQVALISQLLKDEPCDEDLPIRPQPNGLAYVFYTSGSTGLPKGAMVEHQGMVNHLYAKLMDLKLTDTDVVAQNASQGFDISLWQLIAVLLVGGRVHIFEDDAAQHPLELCREVDRGGVSILETVPTMLRAMVESLRVVPVPDRPTLSTLRWLISNAEALEPHLCEEWFTLYPAVKMINTWGATECSDDTTHFHMEEAPKGNFNYVPLGFPLPNIRMYTLDKYLKPVPLGIPGELHVAGIAVGRGYLHDPIRTAEVFIPDPFTSEAGRRLYKTGDLGRHLPDYNLDFLGRLDHQVKIRGFRIDLNEIQMSLSELSSVLQAVVMSREDRPGRRIIVAYIVTRPDQEVTISELRDHLKQRLPEYMVPSAFMILDKFPLTPNGKIDRRALPAPGPSRPDLDPAHVSARNETEEVLASIWKKALGVEEIGIHDNFFELGGDSILSIQIITRANEAGLKLSPKQLFQNQTIAELAAVAGISTTDKAEQGLLTGELPLTPPQLEFFEQGLKNPHHYNQSVILQAERELNKGALEEAVRQLLRQHDALRLRFKEEAAGYRQYLSAETEGVVSYIDLSKVDEERLPEVVEAAGEQLQASLNLEQGPVVRVGVFDADGSSSVMIVIHHLAVDGVSWRILLDDLQSAYDQAARGATVGLGSKTSSYRQWAKALESYSQREQVRQEASYWEGDRWLTVKSLPVDLQGENTAGSIEVEEMRLSEEETARLLREVPEAYHTRIDEVLVAALVRAVSQWTRDTDVEIEMEGHGREEVEEGIDVTRTVGWFTAIYPLLIEVGQGLEETLKRVKQEIRRVPGKGIPYGVMKYLGAAEDAERLRSVRQPEISFNYLGQFDQVMRESESLRVRGGGIGREQGEEEKRSYLIEVNGLVAGGQLQMSFSYSRNCHRRETIARLAEDFRGEIMTVIDACQRGRSGAYTPSDFPLARLSQEEVDRLVEEYGDVEDIYSLTPMQEGMLFHCIYAPGKGMYVEQLSCVLQQQFDVTAFKRAWQAVVDRYSILRTAFVWEGLEKPLQVVLKHVRLSAQEQDWSGYNADEQEKMLAELLEADNKQDFSASQAPLIRIRLIRKAESVYQFIWTYHHLVLDGWSIATLLNDIFLFYNAYSGGEHLELPKERPYKNYIAWLKQQDMRKAEAYWRSALKGFHMPTPLLMDKPSGDSPSHAVVFEKEETALDVATTASLMRMTRQYQLTVNTVVQGIWALMLSRYSGLEDVVFGATVAGRPAAISGIEQMVGLFINTLPVRIKVNDEMKVSDWLKELQQQQVEMREYEYSPLVEVQRWSELGVGEPLFDNILVYENYPVDEEMMETAGGLDVESFKFEDKMSYPITVRVGPGRRLGIRIDYDTSMYEGETIRRVLRQMSLVMKEIAEGRQGRVGELPLMSESEHRQIIAQWNDTAREYPQDLCVHELFEEQVERSPQSGALVFEESMLTYEELNRRANQLAHHLIEFGIGPESLVAVCLHRSTEMIIALLAILKAGAAYLPIDPDYPLHRISFMLDDTRASLILTQSHLTDNLPSVQALVVCLDDDYHRIGLCPAVNPPSRACPDNLAYVIYTSGSTGQPKGVAIPHRGVVRLVRSTNYVNVGPEEVFLQYAPISFDASTFEIWGCLLNGSRLVVFGPEAGSLHQLGQTIQRSSVTTLWLTASLFHQMVEQEADSLLGVRQLLAGGEEVSAEHVKRAMNEVPGLEVINGYGPTENTTFTCCYRVKDGRQVGSRVPIGEAISNTQVYVLDGRMAAVGEGMRGELYIGGEGLARCYLGRPDQTAERFVPSGYSERGGQRLYRSGDEVRNRFRAIEFEGRKDQQVKVRGYRIELGEIEAALNQHSVVRESVVLVREDDSGFKQLVAYIVPDQRSSPATADRQFSGSSEADFTYQRAFDGAAARSWSELEEVGIHSIKISDLRAYLKEKLPEYMVPSAFVLLGRLPLTPNGKIDRRALPEPGHERTQMEDDYVAPSTDVERVLAEVWAEVLKLDKVGVYDDFFELGGHSLLAMQVISRVREAFQVEVPLSHIFESPTVKEFASSVLHYRDQDEGSDIQVIVRDNSEPKEDLLTRVDDLSDEEVNSLLNTLLAEGGANQ